MKFLSKKVECNAHGQDSSYFLGWQEYEKNPYDEVRNPQGIIQMGLAENQLCFDLLEWWLAQNPDVVGFKKNGESIFKELALYQDYHGLPAFKIALTEFMAQIRGNKVSFDPNNLVLTAGATAANETLMFCLANPGEAFLVPTPYYPGFDRDLKWRTEVEIVPILCNSTNGFRITESALVEAYQEAKKRNLRVKGVLVTNPSNPLGITLSLQELNLLVNFIATKKIHLISDEIYSGLIFNPPDFVSVMEMMTTTKYINTNIHKQIHIIYSLSKDLGIPGFRVGAIYSNNKKVISAATKMSSFGLVSSQTQYLLSAMLSDKIFTKNYVEENRKRLKHRQEILVRGLRNAGIRCLEGNAGLFCWIDMRHLLNVDTFEEEMKIWKKIIYEVGLNISPGSSCHCVEPGWFRVCFANLSEETLNVAMRRMKVFVNSISKMTINGGRYDSNKKSKNKNSRRSKSLANWVFGVSFHHDIKCERQSHRSPFENLNFFQ